MKKRKLLFKITAGIAIGLIILMLINSIPTWNLKSRHMKQQEGAWINVYYEEEEEAAKDIYFLVEDTAKIISEKLGFLTKQDVSIYVYDNQKTMQTKKYGLLTPILKLDWYIGDNIGTDVILTSPANPGNEHSYNSVKFAVLHEMVHAYTSILNPRLKLWLKEGVALYLTNGEPFHPSYLNSIIIPSYSDIQTSNPVKFANIGGYTLAHIYIEYLDVTYGWETVLELIKEEDYLKVLGVSKEEIYKEWVEYLKNYSE